MALHILKSSILILVLFINGDNLTSITISSCCSGMAGKCTGSSYCTACSNCSRCAHCNAGGTCGVCSGRNSAPARNTNTYSTPVYSTPNSGNSNYSTGSSNEVQLKLVVISQELTLRAGPGTDFKSLGTLTLGDQVIYLGKESEWVYVRTKSLTKGYVYYKFVKFIQ